jgi:Divergent InlB B-repeat domain/Secretion system C-terminal sorting domain/Beta-propeller repeat
MKTKITFYLATLLLNSFFMLLTLNANAQAPNYLWAKNAGGGNYYGTNSFTVDKNGNSYVTGSFNNASIKFGAITLTNADSLGSSDIFIVKYDPFGNVLWAKSAGGNYDDNGIAVVVDTAGNVYFAGSFTSSSIKFGTKTLTNIKSGTSDLFIVKYDTRGNVIWAKSEGSTDNDDVSAITVSKNGNIYLTGGFSSPSISFDSFTLTNNSKSGYYDIYIVKLNTTGNTLWAKSAGGHSSDLGTSVIVDANENLSLAGYFSSNSISLGKYTLINNDTSGTSTDTFIIRYNASGTLLWANSAGGTQYEISSFVTVDANGNSCVVGYFSSDLITFGADSLINTKNIAGNAYDMFIVKYNTSGKVVWAKSEGGPDYEKAYSVNVDANGNFYVTGKFSSKYISFGKDTLTNADTTGNQDIFIVKYDGSGNALWAERAGGTDSDVAYSIALDTKGNVYVAGYFYSPSIIFGSDTLNKDVNYNADIFIVKLGSTIILPSYSITVSASPSNGGSVNGSGNYTSGTTATITANANTGYTFTNWTENGIQVATNTTYTFTVSTNRNLVANFTANTPSAYTIDVIAKPDIGGSISIAGTPISGTITTVVAEANPGYTFTKWTEFGITVSINPSYSFTLTSNRNLVANFIITPTGIVNQEMNNLIHVYPNPSTGVFNVQLNSTETTQLKVSDSFGKSVYQNKDISPSQITIGISIDLSSQTNGVYFLEITTGKNTRTEKIILEK